MRRRHFLGLAGAAALGTGRPGLVSANGSSALGYELFDPQEDPRLRAIHRLIEAKMAEYHVPGVGFGLLKGDALSLGGFGLTNLDNPQPVSPDTVFPIASISKTAVTTAMLRLVEQGRVDLEAPVTEYIRDFRVADADATRDVRVWHLLTHTPGWEGQLGTPDRGSETLANFTAGLTDLPQLARPGEVWSYNNAGFGVAGRVLEVLTDGSVNDALSDLVFEPLGLTHAFTRTGTAMTHRFAAAHRDRRGETQVIRPFSLPANVAAGGAAMSISSLMSYARFHLGDGTGPDGQRVLTRASLELMRTPRLQKNSTTDEMGVGWHLRRLSGVQTAVHCGTLGGHCLHLQLVPERDLAFGILTNHNQGWRLNSDVEKAILETYEDLALAPGQATGGNRGGNEVMTDHAEALARQPSYGQYEGRYDRPPSRGYVVAVSDGRLVLEGSGSGGSDVPLLFWGPDIAYAAPDPGTSGPYHGTPVEFIREVSGEVRWVRVNGRIARKA